MHGTRLNRNGFTIALQFKRYRRKILKLKRLNILYACKYRVRLHYQILVQRCLDYWLPELLQVFIAALSNACLLYSEAMQRELVCLKNEYNCTKKDLCGEGPAQRRTCTQERKSCVVEALYREGACTKEHLHREGELFTSNYTNRVVHVFTALLLKYRDIWQNQSYFLAMFYLETVIAMSVATSKKIVPLCSIRLNRFKLLLTSVQNIEFFINIVIC